MICGVYIIYNLTNKSFYIGSSYNIRRRISEHKRQLRNSKHYNIILQRSYNRGSKFLYSVLKECSRTDKLYWEQYYMDNLNPYYNIAKNSKAPMEGRKHSIKTLEKFKKRKTHPKGKSHPNYGRKKTPDQRKKASEVRIGCIHSDKVKEKMSKTAKRINSISRLDQTKLRKPIIDNIGNEYESLTSASNKLNISISAICDNLKGRSKRTICGKQFRYKDEE